MLVLALGNQSLALGNQSLALGNQSLALGNQALTLATKPWPMATKPISSHQLQKEFEDLPLPFGVNYSSVVVACCHMQEGNCY